LVAITAFDDSEEFRARDVALVVAAQALGLEVVEASGMLGSSIGYHAQWFVEDTVEDILADVGGIVFGWRLDDWE
jgi:hypothetical protein